MTDFGADKFDPVELFAVGVGNVDEQFEFVATDARVVNMAAGVLCPLSEHIVRGEVDVVAFDSLMLPNPGNRGSFCYHVF